MGTSSRSGAGSRPGNQESSGRGRRGSQNRRPSNLNNRKQECAKSRIFQDLHYKIERRDSLFWGVQSLRFLFLSPPPPPEFWDDSLAPTGVCGALDQIQGFVHVRPALHPLSHIPSLLPGFPLQSSCHHSVSLLGNATFFRPSPITGDPARPCTHGMTQETHSDYPKKGGREIRVGQQLNEVAEAPISL